MAWEFHTLPLQTSHYHVIWVKNVLKLDLFQSFWLVRHNNVWKSRQSLIKFQLLVSFLGYFCNTINLSFPCRLQRVVWITVRLQTRKQSDDCSESIWSLGWEPFSYTVLNYCRARKQLTANTSKRSYKWPIHIHIFARRNILLSALCRWCIYLWNWWFYSFSFPYWWLIHLSRFLFKSSITSRIQKSAKWQKESYKLLYVSALGKVDYFTQPFLTICLMPSCLPLCLLT